MAKFLEAFNLTAKREGGYTDNHDDNGNWTGGKVGSGILVGTKYGVSAPVLAKYLGRIPTVEDMRNLSVEDSQKIYKSNYWDKIHGDEIESQLLANKFYDNSVNMGTTGAIELWQKDVLNVPVTGIMDSVTINKLNQKS